MTTLEAILLFTLFSFMIAAITHIFIQKSHTSSRKWVYLQALGLTTCVAGGLLFFIDDKNSYLLTSKIGLYTAFISSLVIYIKNKKLTK